MAVFSTSDYFPQPLEKFSGLAQYVLLWTMIIMKEIHSLLYHLIGICTKIKQQIICNRKKILNFKITS